VALACKAGGPLRGVSNLVERLSDEFEFWVVTREPSARLARALLSLFEPIWTNTKRSNHEGASHVRYSGYGLYGARC
jgi:hypothetical protein